MHTNVRSIVKKVNYLSVFLLMGISWLPVFSDPIAKGKEKFLGNIIASNPPSDFSNYWNQVSPENSGKWGNVERSRDTMSWETLKKAYDFAKQNNYPFKQHTFVWGQQEPTWIKDVTPEEQKEELEEFIRLFGEKFPDAEFADVVNEPINTPASYREALGGAGTSGWDWVVWTFEKARKYLPKTKLLLNEWGVINDDAMTEKYLGIINLLKGKNLIDAIGEQSHCFSFQNDDPQKDIDPQVLKRNLDKLAAAGLPIYITELDLQGNDSIQLQRYQRYFPVLWEHPAVKGITLWGYRFNRTWIETTWLQDTTNADRPALKWLRSYVTSTKIIAKENNKKSNVSVSPLCIENNQIEINGKEPVLLELFTLQGEMVRSLVLKGTIPVSALSTSVGSYILRANRIYTSTIQITR